MLPSYEKILQAAKDVLPDHEDSGERFVIPNVRGHVQGNKTIISNIIDIAKTLGRKPEHMVKFLNKELATKGQIRNNLLIFNTKVPAKNVNERIQQYAEIYVLCKECGKPDSKLEKRGDVPFMTCHACGAKYPIKSKI
jgi:translation initiation factor 2 subunit 2